MDPRVLARYNSPEGADSYRNEYRAKLHRKVSDKLERKLFERIFQQTGRLESFLDLPCGRGRLRSLFLEHADKLLEADWSYHMLVGNRGDHGPHERCSYLRASGLALPFAEDSFDGVASIRLNHHMDEEQERIKHVRELMRVARRYVIVTFFDYHSFKNRLRRFRATYNKKRPKATMSIPQLQDLAREQGWRLAMAPQLSWIGSGHRFALLENTKHVPSKA